MCYTKAYPIYHKMTIPINNASTTPYMQSYQSKMCDKDKIIKNNLNLTVEPSLRMHHMVKYPRYAIYKNS